MKDFIIFGIACFILGFSLTHLYHINQEAKLELEYIQIAEDIIHRQGYEYKQKWIQRQQPIVCFSETK